MNKTKAIKILREKLGGISELKKTPQDCSFEYWYTSTCNALENIFHATPTRVEDFKKIKFSKGVSSIVTDDSKIYIQGLNKSANFLTAAIEEVDVFYPDTIECIKNVIAKYFREMLSPKGLVGTITLALTVVAFLKTDPNLPKENVIASPPVVPTSSFQISRNSQDNDNAFKSTDKNTSFTTVTGFCPVEEIPAGEFRNAVEEFQKKLSMGILPGFDLELIFGNSNEL